ncbi:MAG: PEP-utilizing enzyme [Parcubacteria group bacterium]
MSKAVITEYQPSITEWFAAIGEITESAEFRKEDNMKTDRLEHLYETIGLPYERPEILPARELTDLSLRFQKILKEQGEKLCAIRLVPLDTNLPKLRLRGLSLKECYETWYRAQHIDPDAYTAYICPHSDNVMWSTIFLITPTLAFGEIIRGTHSQLTHGDTKETLIQFQYDYQTYTLSPDDRDARQLAEAALSLLKVADTSTQRTLKTRLNASFSHDYLNGYFEAVVWPDGKIYFADFNRILPRYIPAPITRGSKKVSAIQYILSGTPASPGTAVGVVRVVHQSEVTTAEFSEGDILVCTNTDVRYLPLMKRAGAIVTDLGGILSHASLISRELNVPCIVNTKKATQLLHPGQRVIVDASSGLVMKT